MHAFHASIFLACIAYATALQRNTALRIKRCCVLLVMPTTKGGEAANRGAHAQSIFNAAQLDCFIIFSIKGKAH